MDSVDMIHFRKKGENPFLPPPNVLAFSYHHNKRVNSQHTFHLKEYNKKKV